MNYGVVPLDVWNRGHVEPLYMTFWYGNHLRRVVTAGYSRP